MDKFEPLDNEKWVWCKTFKEDYSDEYLVSDMGRCWSIKKRKFVGHWQDGYWKLTLTKNKIKEYTMMIGRLMLTSFNIPIPEHLQGLPTSKLQAMHLDGDSTNNNLNNFAWGDHLENCNEINRRIRLSEAHKGKKGAMLGRHLSEETKRKMSEVRKGKKISLPLNNKKSKTVYQYTLDGELVNVWPSTMECKRNGFNQGEIAECCRGGRFKNGKWIKRETYKGYKWSYVPL